MHILILRWVLLFISVASSLYLIRFITVAIWIAVLALLSTCWIGYTIYSKRVFKWSILSYILTPLLVWASALSLLIFMNGIVQQVMIIGFAFVLSWVWSSTLLVSGGHQDTSVFRGNLMSYINSFILFFTASSLFAADVFLSFSKWYALLLIFVLSFTLHLQTMRASHSSLNRAWIYSFASALIIVEIFGILIFWPSSFLVNGGLLTVGFYILTGVSRCMLTSILSRKLIGKYLAWGSLIIFAILITADWQ